MKGGRRPGAGRKPGSLTTKTRAIAEQAAASGKTPLEIMLEAVAEVYLAKGPVAAFDLAKDAAPYLHPRIATVGPVINTLPGEMKSLEELDRLYEEAMRKAEEERETMQARRQ
jgi:hypothetical protein